VFAPSAFRHYLKQPKPLDAVLFLHRRTSRGGGQRLVLVQLSSLLVGRPDPTANGDATCYVLQISAAGLPLLRWTDTAPPTITEWQGASFVMTRNWEQGPQGVQAVMSRRTRFFSGRPDPADAARFSIDYMIGGEFDTIDGRLKDDGSIELKPRRAKVLQEDEGSSGELWDVLPADPAATTSRPPTSAPAPQGTTTAPAAPITARQHNP
jgi:hypothetical protein